MAIKWADAPIETTLDFIRPGTAYQSTEQEIGKFPPEKDLKKWAIQVGGEKKYIDLFTNNPPSAGETIVIRRFVKVEADGTEKYPKWMLESEHAAAKAAQAPGGGRPGGAPARNYDIENRQIALGAAIAFKGDKDWDKHDVCLLADVFAKYIKTGEIPAKKAAQQ